MDDRLDIIAIWIQYKGAVVAGVIDGPRARSTVVASTCRKRCLIKSIDLLFGLCTGLHPQQKPGSPDSGTPIAWTLAYVNES